MKLSQVYSDKKFKTVKFTEGFNLILGKVSNPTNTKIDSHNLGKTTLISVIDFLLLKEINKDHFLKKYERFKDYTFLLEIELNDGSFLTIKRSVKNNTKISIILHNDRFASHVDTSEWDYANIPLRDAKEILNDKLNFTVLPEYDYRKLVSYYLRTQDDYQDVFKLNKYRGKDIDWKPMLFDLLGFDGENLFDKYKLDQSVSTLKSEIGTIEKRFAVKSEDVDRLKGLIQLKERELEENQKLVSRFNFYKDDMEVNWQLVEEIEREVSSLNSSLYSANFEIEKINISLKQHIDFDLSQVEEIFSDVRLFFPDQLKVRLEDLVKFNEELSIERTKHLKTRLSELMKDVKITELRLKELNENRSNLMSVLQEKDTLTKFKEYHSKLASTDKDLVELREQLNKINQMETINDTIATLETDIKALKEKAKQQVNSDNSLYTDIRTVFSDIIKVIIDLPAVISTKVNTQGNIEYHADIQDVEKLNVTAEGRGTTYRKLLCAAFDLSVLINYSEKGYFRFVYHDGALEGLDNRKKINFISEIKRICSEYGLQYILTSIEHDLPVVDGEPMKFSEAEIALQLSDDGDSGKLFEQSF